ncbi:MAG: hypothetical protein UR93_C0009G0031 [Berkelbacteria bacterium GW2011_GWA2_35_9]|uniref:DUF5668 domain-containing protein n=1 Tax=Berkelbacteria bacterium GW2011_GWA2_35_9 TaxID=1618333 RepID=A0A0G0D657_9BACT|nr:MAG: hypothetical protein UR93_C0009G0031 [Berkelbacteria bacterium GW2011_GWA2_35_9]
MLNCHFCKKEIDNCSCINFGRIFAGLYIILLGIVTLLDSLNLISVNYELIIKNFWSLLIVLIGLSLLSGKNWVSIILGSIFTIFIFAITALLIFSQLF